MWKATAVFDFDVRSDQIPIVFAKTTLTSSASCTTRSGTSQCEFAVGLDNNQAYSIHIHSDTW